MKIRTDFVTNSSSSSFSVTITVKTNDGKEFSLNEDPYNYGFDQGFFDIKFEGDLSMLSKQRENYSSIESLGDFLVNSLYYDLWGDEDDSGADINKDDFKKQLSENINSIDDISQITVVNEYIATGEGMVLIADNDEELCKLAEKVISADGEARMNALQEMHRYIHTPNGNRGDYSFGDGYEDFRYCWCDDFNESELISLAERLCSNHGPDFCEGREYQNLDLKTGAFSKYAEFGLC